MRTLRSGGMWWRALFLVALIAVAVGVSTWTDTADGASSEGTPTTGADVVFVRADERGPGTELEPPKPLEPLGPSEPCLPIEDHVAIPIPTSVPDDVVLVPDGSDHPVCPVADE